MRRGWPGLAVAAVAAALGAPAGAQAAPEWHLEQPAPPAGAPFKVPLGAPGEITFLAPNEGLMSVEGNATIARGLYFYDGVQWRRLSTVCGSSGETSRIAWAGPDEFWTVSEPSLPRTGEGLGLCHFKDGQVVASYSAAPQSPDPFHAMDSAACNGPDDCWFGGIAAQDASGEHVGAFHLHWDGQTLSTVYAPQDRAVSDITLFDGTFYETKLVGVQREDDTDVPSIPYPEPVPFLIQQISGTGTTFSNAPFGPHVRSGVPSDGTELLADDADASDLWLVGGGAASGPDAPPGGAVARPPIAVHYDGAATSFFSEVPIPDGTFPDTDRFTDVAAVPGTDTAWVTVVPFAQRASTTAKAQVALIDAQGHVLEQDTLPSSGAGRGVAAKIACAAANDCWMATQAGWVFHLTDGTQYPQNTDPAFANVITTRPDESAAQFVPDTPPVDDSSLLAPPPPVTQTAPTVTTKRLGPLLDHVKTKLLVQNHGHLLILQLTMTVHRTGTIQVLAKRKGKLVVKTPVWHIHKGFLRIRFRVTRAHYPTALSFKTTDSAAPKGSSTGDSGSQTVLT